MKQPKVIGIFGWEQTDLCIYLASILENMRYHVLVIDNSTDQKMDCCIPRPEAELNIVNYKGVDYRFLVPYEEWTAQEYDFVIVDMGGKPRVEELSVCEEIFLVTGCDYVCIRKYRELMLQMKKPMAVIIRNYQREMMMEKQIVKQLEEENCFVMEHYFLPSDPWDESRRIAMQYQGYRDCRDLSREFEKLLFHLGCMLAQQGYRAVLAGISRAKKGECY